MKFNMNLCHGLLFLTIFSCQKCCSSSPTCCEKFHYHADFLKSLKCGISICERNGDIGGKLCILCEPKKYLSNNISHEANNFLLTKPYLVCQNSFEETASSIQIFLAWKWSEEPLYPAIYLIEARNSSSQIGNWEFVGVTNETFADVNNLDPYYLYQFRISLVVSSVNVLPVLSDWILLKALNRRNSLPQNVTISQFYFQNNFVQAVIKWNASKAMPCVYKILWLPVMSKDHFQEKIIVLPKDSLSFTIEGLSLSTNYSLSISSANHKESEISQSVQVWFVTPSCLELNKGNFSTCAPGPPLNVTVECSLSSLEALLSWAPPLHSTHENSVLSYHIVVSEAIGIYQNVLQYQTSLTVPKNITNVTISNIKLNVFHIFEIRAVSKGGRGLPEFADCITRDVSVLNIVQHIPYHYVAPAFIFPFVAVLVLVLRSVRRGRMHRKLQGCPSGLADVDDDLRPYLVPPHKVDLREIVGQGAFSTVHRGMYLRNKDKEEVAVKIFPAESITRRKLLQEVEIMRLIGRHDSIVGFVGFTLDVEKMYLLFEYCPRGNLHFHLVSLKPELMYMKSIPTSERPHSASDTGHGKRLSSYIHQVAIGMEYISALKLIHRDLAARNILLCSDRKVKIGDFGLSKDVYETKNYSAQTQKQLPIKWMAPEAIEKQRFNTYTDVWSFGVFMWEVFKLGKEPYPGLENGSVLQYLKMGYRLEKPHCSQEWYDIMCSCWNILPRQRPRFNELVKRIGTALNSTCNYAVLT